MMGRIKKLVRDRGFGFVTGEDGIDRFLHLSGLERCQFEDLLEGDFVIFDSEESARGPRAVNVYRA